VILTHPMDHKSMQCLDYFMEVIKRDNQDIKRYKIKENTVDVEKFVVDHKKFTQLSDHYALKGVIVPNADKEVVS
jgi:hypothetical protein